MLFHRTQLQENALHKMWRIGLLHRGRLSNMDEEMKKNRTKDWIRETEKIRQLKIGQHIFFPVGTRLKNKPTYQDHGVLVEVKKGGLYITKVKK